MMRKCIALDKRLHCALQKYRIKHMPFRKIKGPCGSHQIVFGIKEGDLVQFTLQHPKGFEPLPEDDAYS